MYLGMELSEEQLEGIKQAQEKAKLKNKALTLLAARPMSQRELERKLSAKSPRKGEPQEGEEQRQQCVDRRRRWGLEQGADVSTDGRRNGL